MPLDPASYMLAKKAFFKVVDWNSIVNKPSTFPPSTHASSHEYGGSDLIHNLDYLAVRGTTVIDSNRNINNINDAVVSGRIYPPSDGTGGLGLSTNRLYLAYILGLQINYATFNKTAAPDATGKLSFDPADNRLKFHDGTAAQAIAWCDPKALITYILKGAAIFFTEGGAGHVYAFPTTYSDESIQGVTAYNSSTSSTLVARLSDLSNYYRLYIDYAQTTADFRCDKVVAGTVTNLGYEAVDLTQTYNYTIKLECASSSLYCYRTDMTTAKLSIADSSLTSGYFGAGNPGAGAVYYGLMPLILECKLGSTLQPSPEATHFFEVPVVGSGTNEDPFRPQMPEEIRFTSEEAKRKYEFLKTAGFTDNEINALLPGLIQKVNLLALNVSSLIKTGRDGKPAEYTAIVRIMPQPDRPPHLKPISECIEALKRIPDAKQLTPEQAVKKALEIDDKIHIYDLKANPHPAKKDIGEYIQWRKNTHGVEMPEEKAEAYIKTPKGWA
jgi:hypothetical protein